MISARSDTKRCTMQAAITKNTDDELVIYSSARDTTYRFLGCQSQLQVSSTAGERTIGFADILRADFEEHNDFDGYTYGVKLVLRGSSPLSLIPVETHWGAPQDMEALAGQINAFLDRWCSSPFGPRDSDVLRQMKSQMKNMIGQFLSASGNPEIKERRINDIIDMLHAPLWSPPVTPTPSGTLASDLGHIKEIIEPMIEQLAPPPGASASDVRRFNKIIDKMHARLSSPPVTPTLGFSGRLRLAVARCFTRWIMRWIAK